MTHIVDVARDPARLLEAVSTAEGGEEVLVQRNGRLVARLVPTGITEDTRAVQYAKSDAYIRGLENLADRLKGEPVLDRAAAADDLYDENGLPH